MLGFIRFAASVGVMAVMSATLSHTETSIVWPIAVITGHGLLIIIATTFSSSKQAKSPLLPPPLARIITSGLKAKASLKAVHIESGAEAPWTIAPNSFVSSVGYLLDSVFKISLYPAASDEEIIASLFTKRGIGLFLSSSKNQPYIVFPKAVSSSTS